MRDILLDVCYPLDVLPTQAKVGLLALASDFCIEDDLRMMLPQGVQVYTNRVTNKLPITPENLRDMQADIARAAQALLPGNPPDCFIYGCTSGTATIGYQTICGDIAKATGRDVPIITPFTASIEAMRYLGVSRVSLLTPYVHAVSQHLAQQFTQAGITMTHHGYFGIGDDYQVHCINPQDLLDAAKKIHDPAAEALFMSCTSFRAAEIVEELEEMLSIPVVCSNQALVFGVLQALQIPYNIKGYGRLLHNSI